jgi:hypothetical protein
MKLVIFFVNLCVLILTTKPDDQIRIDPNDFDHSDFLGFEEAGENSKETAFELPEDYIIN